MKQVKFMQSLAILLCICTMSLLMYILAVVGKPHNPVDDIIQADTETLCVETTEQMVETTEQMIETTEATEQIIETTELIETAEPVPTIEPVEWWTSEELDMLAAVIYYEAGSRECTDRHQQLVGQVVLNRVADNRYPNTIYEVITDTKYGVQYSTAKLVIANMGNMDIIPQRCYDNALIVLSGKVYCPKNVIYQANFKQGYEIYEEIHTSYSISYFCYG